MLLENLELEKLKICNLEKQKSFHILIYNLLFQANSFAKFSPSKI